MGLQSTVLCAIIGTLLQEKERHSMEENFNVVKDIAVMVVCLQG